MSLEEKTNGHEEIFGWQVSKAIPVEVREQLRNDFEAFVKGEFTQSMENHMIWSLWSPNNEHVTKEETIEILKQGYKNGEDWFSKGSYANHLAGAFSSTKLVPFPYSSPSKTFNGEVENDFEEPRKTLDKRFDRNMERLDKKRESLGKTFDDPDYIEMVEMEKEFRQYAVRKQTEFRYDPVRLNKAMNSLEMDRDLFENQVYELEAVIDINKGEARLEYVRQGRG